MIKHNQDGQISAIVVSLILTAILLIGAVGFGAWAFTSRQDYKTNTDEKIASAVTVAKQQEDSLKDKAFLEKEKSPFRTYNGPEAFGSIQMQYPKTWSGYVDDTGSNALLDGYFDPGVVPSLTNSASVFALRVQVLSQSYSQVMQEINGQMQSGKLVAQAYTLPHVQKAVGVKVSGTFGNGKTGIMVILPLRNQTIEISTQGSQFTADFENSILPNFTFLP